MDTLWVVAARSGCPAGEPAACHPPALAFILEHLWGTPPTHQHHSLFLTGKLSLPLTFLGTGFGSGWSPQYGLAHSLLLTSSLP